MGSLPYVGKAWKPVSCCIAFNWSRRALLPFVLLCTAIMVPYLWYHGFALAATVLQRLFGLVCHQDPERAFWLFGGSVAVCARCLGTYAGATVGLLCRVSRLLALRLMVVGVLINIADVATELAGWHGNWLEIRFVFGLLLGGAAALVLSSSIHSVDHPS